MTDDEAHKLNNGVYKIYWKDGGSSVAAIGRTHSGKVWLMPANWINENVTTDYWTNIERVKLIKKSKT